MNEYYLTRTMFLEIKTSTQQYGFRLVDGDSYSEFNDDFKERPSEDDKKFFYQVTCFSDVLGWQSQLVDKDTVYIDGVKYSGKEVLTWETA